jgi:hypothetical protein
MLAHPGQIAEIAGREFVFWLEFAFKGFEEACHSPEARIESDKAESGAGIPGR